MANFFDSVGSKTEGATNFLGDLNAILEPLASPESLLGDSLQSVDGCLTELIVNIALVRDSGVSDGEQQKYLLKALTSPFNEFTQAMKGLFNIGDGDLSDIDFKSAAQTFSQQLLESLKNPFAAILQAQAVAFQSSMDQASDILVGQNSVPSQVWGKLEYMFTSLFTDEQEAGYKFGGLLWFALSEGLPAVDSELRYLHQMKRQLNTVIEESSKLPPKLTPALPSFYASVQLCEAEQRLKEVASQLRREDTFNRSAFSTAKTEVCNAALVMRSGNLPDSSGPWLKDIFGFDDRQISALKGRSFLPNAKFQVATTLLRSLHAYAQEQDYYTRSLHTNLIHLTEVLLSTLSFQMGDILAVIIDVIRVQVTTIRTDLDGMAQGFARTLPDSLPARVDGTPQPQAFNPDTDAYEDDILALLSAQAAAAIALEVLCYVLGRVRQIYNTIDKVLNSSREVMKIVYDTANQYNQGMKACGDGSGMTVVRSRLESFFRAAEGRMRGDQSAEYVAARAKDLKVAITEHEQFLSCMRLAMFNGERGLMQSAMFVANAIAFAKNLMNIIRTSREMYQAIKTLDIKKMLGVDGMETTALAAIIRALQCFVLQCNNPFIASLAEQATRQFQGSLDANKSRTVTVGTLDEVAKSSRSNNIGATISSFLRLIRSIQQLIDMDLTKLCNINAAPVTATNAPPPVPVSISEVSDLATQIVNEEAQAEEARNGASPFGGALA